MLHKLNVREKLIDWIEFYAVSAIFQPCNGGKKVTHKTMQVFAAIKIMSIRLKVYLPGSIVEGIIMQINKDMNG